MQINPDVENVHPDIVNLFSDPAGACYSKVILTVPTNNLLKQVNTYQLRVIFCMVWENLVQYTLIHAIHLSAPPPQIDSLTGMKYTLVGILSFACIISAVHLYYINLHG